MGAPEWDDDRGGTGEPDTTAAWDATLRGHWGDASRLAKIGVRVHDADGRGTALYRAGELLLARSEQESGRAAKALELLAREYDAEPQEYRTARTKRAILDRFRFGSRVRPAGPERPAETTLDFLVIRGLPADLDLVALAERLREELSPDGRPLLVGPNHVLGYAPVRKFGPALPPEPIEGVALTPERLAASGEAKQAITVGVVDTGTVLSSLGHPLLQGRYAPSAPGDSRPRDDVDPLVDDPGGRVLDAVGAHGTFVAGRILEQAPMVQVHAESSAEPRLGILVTDAEVARDLTAAVTAGCDVVNLSIAGPAALDRAPIALAATIANLDPEVVLVAAAGNEGDDRPSWPAACKRVIGVAAVDRDGEPTPWTNRGWWVDCCTYGNRVRGPYPKALLDLGGTSLSFGGEARWSGTSFAAPRVAGIIARVAATEGLAPQEAAARVLREAEPHPSDPGLGLFVQ